MSEVVSVNGKTGVVVLTAANVEAVPESEAGQPNGVATLDSSGQLPEAQLPSSVERSSLKALGNISGLTVISFAAPGVFTATLTGATEIEPTELAASPPRSYVLKVTTAGHTFSIKGISWIGSEPVFGTGTYAISLLVIEGALYGLIGLEGSEGKAGNTILFGESVPAEGLGASGNFYIRLESGKPKSIYGPKSGLAWGEPAELKGEKGTSGSTGPTGSASIEGYLKLALPVYAGASPRATAYSAIGVAFKAVFALICLPVGGTLHDITLINGETVNGNHNVAVFDTGQTKAGEYTLLWESGSIAASGAQKYQIVGDPALTGRETGEKLLLAIMNSGTTNTFGVGTQWIGSELPLLPSGFGLPARLLGFHTFAELKYKTLKESELEKYEKTLLLMGRLA